MLVATDLAARGIDVDNVSHVFNFDLPQRGRDVRPSHRPHRRAGATGIAVSFCDSRQSASICRAIERLLRQSIAVDAEHTVQNLPALPPETQKSGKPAHGGGGARNTGSRPFHKPGKPRFDRRGTGKKSSGGQQRRRRAAVSQ